MVGPPATQFIRLMMDITWALASMPRRKRQQGSKEDAHLDAALKATPVHGYHAHLTKRRFFFVQRWHRVIDDQGDARFVVTAISDLSPLLFQRTWRCLLMNDGSGGGTREAVAIDDRRRTSVRISVDRPSLRDVERCVSPIINHCPRPCATSDQDV